MLMLEMPRLPVKKCWRCISPWGPRLKIKKKFSLKDAERCQYGRCRVSKHFFTGRCGICGISSIGIS